MMQNFRYTSSNYHIYVSSIIALNFNMDYLLGKQIWMYNLFLIIRRQILTCLHIFPKQKVSVLMSSIRNGVNRHFGLKKLHLKNQWNLHFLLFVYCWKSQNMVNFNKFHRFLSAVFWAQNVLLPTFLYYWGAIKAFFTALHQLLPTFILLLLTFSTVYHFIPTFLTFHQLLPTFILVFTNYLPSSISFILLFINQKRICFFFHLLTSTSPTYCWLSCYRHYLLVFFYIICGAFIHYTKP